MQALVSIIIINWNGKDVLRECLQSLRHIQYPKKEIIVLDNNSTDGSCNMVRRQFPWVHVVRYHQNVGFAEGNNLAMRHIKGKYVLLLNNDTVVTPDFLSYLVEDLEKDPHLGVVQPKILYKGHPLYKDGRINSIGAYLTSTGFLYYPGYGKLPNRAAYNKRQEIFSAYGACMLIRKSIIDQIGLFDPDFFAYFEETDFCHRVWLSGFTVIYEPSSRIYHVGGVSSRKHNIANILYHSYKNRMCSHIKNLGLGSFMRVLPVHLFLCVASIFVYALSGRPGSSLAVTKALLYNAGHLRITLKKRAYIQKHLRRLADKDFLPRVTRSVRLSYYFYLFYNLELYRD